MILHSFFDSIRGWLPEEPKMPKSKLKRLRTTLVAMFVASTVFSLFSYSFFFSNHALLVPPPMIVPSAPNSSYVELTGVSDADNSFILVLDNGNQVCSKNLTMALSITEKGGDACTAWLTVEGDTFYKEASADGEIVDGNLVIDSRKSLFLINPDLSRGQVVLTETGDWQLHACVANTERRFLTAVDSYVVTAVGVSASASRTAKGWPISLNAGYDPNTGILIYSAFSISDVLLEKLGIDLIIGGLKLVSYSENLNLEVANRPSPGLTSMFGSILALLLVSAPVTAPVLGYLLYRRRKRMQAAASNVPESGDNSTQNCDNKGW
jgi:hypothetical protein